MRIRNTGPCTYGTLKKLFHIPVFAYFKHTFSLLALKSNLCKMAQNPEIGFHIELLQQRKTNNIICFKNLENAAKYGTSYLGTPNCYKHCTERITQQSKLNAKAGWSEGFQTWCTVCANIPLFMSPLIDRKPKSRISLLEILGERGGGGGKNLMLNRTGV